jgi:hypothetical protein
VAPQRLAGGMPECLGPNTLKKNDFSRIFKLKNYFQKFYFEKGKGLDKSSMQMQGFEKSNMQFWK